MREINYNYYYLQFYTYEEVYIKKKFKKVTTFLVKFSIKVSC